MTVKTQACWIGTAPATRYDAVSRSFETEVVVIGAGIVGLTAAWLLARAGVDVAVLEGQRVARGVTARSTAKVTSQHGIALAPIAKRHGEERARLYAQANAAGAAWVVETANALGIACDLETRDAYAYALHDERLPELDREVELAQKFGLPAERVSRVPLPFATAGGLVFRDQAQFNPARYLVGLARAVRAAGARIYERSRATDAKQKETWQVSVGRHRIRAKHVVMACHMPIASPVPFDEITQPRCHLAMAFRAPADALDGMFIGVDDPTRSLRIGRDAQGSLLIALAPQFPTGHDGDIEGRFQALERWVRDNVPAAGSAAWRWINEDYDSPDDVPFAGRLAKAKGLYVATGFGGWGISNGTAAGILIAEQIQGRQHPWSQLYAPERRAKKSNKGGDTHTPLLDTADLRAGEGGVITRGKQKIAVHRRADGTLQALSAACTHKGCTVTWSNADRTWQCPCHGSIFAAAGSVLHGPATEPLKPAKVPRA
jgi:glycine/D-amino acid oxidase-like deaminating enzyme/nitrite reductase/ring-hydroxylating ferredoxin subunit